MTSRSSPGYKAVSAWMILFFSAVMVAACGGGGGAGGGSSQSAGIGGTGISTARGYVRGEITGFGSIYVNGGRYRTDSSKFVVDGDDSLGQDDLEVGMVVTMEVETSSGKYAGNALKVTYDDEIEGPVAAAPIVIAGGKKQFEVFNQLVTIDATGTLFKNTSFADIDAGDVVEISGLRASPTEIIATFVKKTGDLVLGSTEVELRGTIENLTPGPFPDFEVNGITITTDASTVTDVPGNVLVEGLYVEIKGIIMAADSVYAEEIEEEDEGFGEDADDVSLQGIVSGYNSLKDFRINGQPIDASGAELEPANAEMLLGDGVEIEVEGNIVGGVLIADELEIEDSDAELESFVGQVNTAGKWFSLSFPTGTVVIRTDSKTAFEDEAGPNPVENMGIGDLNMATDFVKVEGREVNDEILASTVKRTDAEDALKIRGRVDAHDPGVSITILGVVYQVDGSTSYSPSNAFAAGDFVEIEDEGDPLPADGVADKVEVE